MYKIALLAGDGVGPEIMDEAVKIIHAVEEKYNLKFILEKAHVGGVSVDLHAVPLTKEALDLCKECDAVLFGAVGGPKWDDLPKELRPEQAILNLRKSLGLYANLRPIYFFDALKDSSPIKNEIIDNSPDILIVRELTGGLYFGKPKETIIKNGVKHAVDTMEYSEKEISRVAHIAFKAALNRRKNLTSVDKANVLETSRLWRTVVSKISKEYPDVRLNHMYVDNCAMQLVQNPGRFDVILTENTFGDILSDEASVLTGSIGILPSASLGDDKPFLYEPIHGSAPDIAGKGIANPIACILSVAMMMEYSFDQKEISNVIVNAVNKIINEGYRTYDIKQGGSKIVTTAQMGDLIKKAILDF